MKIPFLNRLLGPKPDMNALTEALVSPHVTSGQIVEAMFMAVPEMGEHLQQESFTRADIELALDDRGWLTPNARTFQELDPATRNIKISQSRMYWTADPLAKQAVRLWTDYCLGNGFSYHCEEADVQTKLDAFMKDRRNRRLTSAMGQRRSSHKLLIDGDNFFIFFRNGEDSALVRYLDPLQIEEIVTHEDDQEMILGYKRKDAKGNVFYYKDWAAPEDELDHAIDHQDQKKITTWTDDQDQVVYHIAFDSLDKRGNGLLTTALGWTREHRRFMEARVALTQALSKFAWKLTAKVGEKGIQAIQNRIQSSLSSTGFTGAPEKNPTPAPGGTFAQNSGVDMVPMPRSTGSGDATGDSNQLKLMVCAATGIFLHYFGDPSTGNLATATAMELPMLKMFSAYQQLWQDAWRDIFAIALGEDPDQEPADIAIDMPPILSDDVGELGDFIMNVAGVFPEMKIPQVLRMLFSSINVPDISEAMDAAAELKDELDAQADVNRQMEMERLKAAQAEKNKSQPQPAASPQESAALDRLTAAISESNKVPAHASFPELPQQPMTVEVVTPLAESQMAKVIKEVTEAIHLPRKKTVTFLKDADGTVLGANVEESAITGD